jgi:hypothetical protein
VNGHQLPDVHWTWGIDFPRERRWTDGWGSSIEVPAVIELLDLIAAGKTDAPSVRAAIIEYAEAMDADHDPHHSDPQAQRYARCFGDCDICKAAEDAFRRSAAEAQARIDKARDPDNYPYILMGRTAHLTVCTHASPSRWAGQPADEAEFRRRLKGFAHKEGISEYQGEPVDWDGLLRWSEANIGPQGGRYYRACKVCKPQLP